jgi:hypothetical protein
VLGRKIVLIIVTLLLLAAFGTVVWLRWLVISEQLGISNNNSEAATFGVGSSFMIWSKVGPTIVINILVWGLGTLYSWALQERIPGLRESYREYLRASRVLEKRVRPFQIEEKRLNAYYTRERDKNRVTIDECKSLLENVKSTIDRLRERT